MAEVELNIAGRAYRVACRAGEEQHLLSAGAMVDAKSREAIAGLGMLSEGRQLLFAALLLADQLISKPGAPAAPATATPDPATADRAAALANRLEALATALEQDLEQVANKA